MLGLAVSTIFVPAALAETQVTASYLYSLADFQGPVESLWARIAVDEEQGEIYTLNRSNSMIGIYNETAMQIFTFGEGLNLSSASDITAGDNGDLFILYRYPTARVLHLDYRGKTLNQINISSTIPGIKPFKPDFIDYHAGKLYLAESVSMQVLITQLSGQVENTYDLRTLVSNQIKERADSQKQNDALLKKTRKDLEDLAKSDLGGFSVDSHGNIYFTLSTLFAAYRFNPNSNSNPEGFGIPGSAPGKFGVVAGICADSQGNIYVTDRLRSVVMIFDPELRFLSEFGYRGGTQQNLMVPDDIAIDGLRQRIYVAQAANRGVSIFRYRMN